MAETIYEHITAFGDLSKHHITTCSIFGDIPEEITLDKFDVVMIHYSICIGRGGYLSFKAKEKIRNFQGYKVVFIQDDHRWIYSTITNCYFLGIDALFGIFEQSQLHQVYPKEFLDKVHVESVLTGYVDAKMKKAQFVNYADRTIDVSYRARKLAFWMGRHSLKKWQIADKFLKQAKKFNLKCDISTKEEDRVYGQAWIRLLKNSKATLGTESGSSICDFTGKIQKNIESFTKKHPNISFDIVEEKFLQDKKNHILLSAISPRIFEAISHKVLLILYPSAYNEILIPWKHYVPLNEDHSNIEEVVSILRSPEKAQKIIECAYQEILFNPKYQYQALIDKFDTHINSVFKNKTPLSGENYIWKFNNHISENNAPPKVQENNLNSLRVVLKLIIDGQISLLFLLRYIPAYLLTRIICKIKSIFVNQDKQYIIFPSQISYFCSCLVKLKLADFFHFSLDKIDLNIDFKSCVIFCSLSNEKNLNHAETLEPFKNLKPDEEIEVNFVYTEYAEAFLDSISEIIILQKTKLTRECIESLIA
ncbi:MAG: glycosyltransferase family 1 protein [Gammaproteobacteria bacterium]|jgi:hypothetical protein|nr:glycosyltransferase family 1 protein [Gammaproteobacteria bacterium]